MTKMATVGHLKGGETKAEAAVLRALARAYAEGTHERFITIVDHKDFIGGRCLGADDQVYHVERDSCTCLAGANGYQFCKHKISLFDRTGRMDELVPNFYERFIFPGDGKQAA